MQLGAFEEEVARVECIFVWADGTERAGQARVGRPYPRDAHTWACPCEITAFDGRYPDAVGIDSMQALCLALYLIRCRLEAFLAHGGRVLNSEREEFDLYAIRRLFGVGRVSRAARRAARISTRFR